MASPPPDSDPRPSPLLPGTRKDAPSVSAAGEPLMPQIDGVSFRPAVRHGDERGILTEVYSTAWGDGFGLVPHVYEVVALPGSLRAWVVHLEQDDRLYFSNGLARIGLYDARPGSATQGTGIVLHLGAHRPGLLMIPRGVYHGIRNVGGETMRFLNLPTCPYDHARPDKYRLPVDDVQIPVEL